MIIDVLDIRPSSRRGFDDILHQRKVYLMVRLRIPRSIHQLNRKVEAPCRRIRPIRRHDVLLAKDRHRAFNGQPRALITVGHHALAEYHALAGFQLDFQGHRFLHAGCGPRIASGAPVNRTVRGWYPLFRQMTERPD